MIPKNLEKIRSFGNYDFYQIQEIGFSNNFLANEHHLYEDFFENGLEYVSAFEAIYNHGLYEKQIINQIWIFKDEFPVGICMAIESEKPLFLKAKESDFKANIAGYIQLYVKDEYRGQGLASQCVPLLETMLEKNNGEINAFIMQDDAYPFRKYLKHGCAISSKLNHGDNFINRGQLKEFFNTILYDCDKLDSYCARYSKFNIQYVKNNTKENKVCNP